MFDEKIGKAFKLASGKVVVPYFHGPRRPGIDHYSCFVLKDLGPKDTWPTGSRIGVQNDALTLLD